ncbi:MAG: phospho-sugar mutase [Clostridia bacterium]|nr:phospho-sugar mutase [Clostridia bacterium]
MNYTDTYKAWLAAVLDNEKTELLEFAEKEQEIKERFSLPLAFGTAGMRGTLGLGTFRMNEYTVRRATAGIAQYVIGLNKQASGVVIAYDTRNMSYEFALTAARVLAAKNIKVFLFENVRPVPICSFSIGYFDAIAGIMITASHNPKEYNGYKVYGSDGAQMSPDATAIVVDIIEKGSYFGVEEADISVKSREEVKGLDRVNINPYIEVVGKSVDEAYYETIAKLSLSPEAVAKEGKNLKIVYTPIHGTGYIPVTTILSRMNIPCSIVEEQASPDGNFPTVKMPNPEQPDALSLGIKLANKLNSDVVIGTDPDADRMGVAVRDNKGEFVLLNGNQIGALLMDYILRRHTERNTFPKNAAVVKTIVTTSLAKKIAESYGATCFDVLTGFKFIGEKIKEWGESGQFTFMFGYEESYGYLAGTHAKDKDAVVSAMLFAEMVCYYKSINISIYNRLQQLFEKFGYFVEKSISIAFSGLDGMTIMADKMKKLAATTIRGLAGIDVIYTCNYSDRIKSYSDGRIEKINLPKTDAMYYSLTGGDWVCARPSGTEPKLKLYVSASADNQRDAETKADMLIAALGEYIK